jgi:hypothetical protein
MPLSEVHAGMHCTGLSVVRGTAISSFDVEVLDVIAGDPSEVGARILVRVSGPAVDATGIGPGFSGSPIVCDGRNAGAISEGIGEYGNKVALATPIEEVLRARPVAAAGARHAPGLLRAPRPLEGPLTVSGLSGSAQRLLARAAARADRIVLSAPPGPLGGYPVQDLQPGASVATVISTGDLGLGAVGTVTYRDGSQVYAFGHSFQGVGPRAGFLEDAYVFTVVNNPLGIPQGPMTYKLASAGGHPVGTLTNDTLTGVAGQLGGAPVSYPLIVTARTPGSSAATTVESQLADERALGLQGQLGLLAPLSVATALSRQFDSNGPLTISACFSLAVAERRAPIRFCNAYFDGVSVLSDLIAAGTLVDRFDLAPLHIRAARVSMTAARGVTDEVLVGAHRPARARAGSRVRVRLVLRRRRGSVHSVTVRVPVPRNLKPGRRELLLAGSGRPQLDQDVSVELAVELAEFGTEAGGEGEPHTVRELAEALGELHRDVGVVARFGHRDPRLVLRSRDVRFDGQALVSLRVARRAP